MELSAYTKRAIVIKKQELVLYELYNSSSVRGLLDYDKPRSDSLMKSLDEINYRYGSSTLKLAAEGDKKRLADAKRKSITLLYY